MRTLRHSRFAAFFALVALFIATTAYEAHGYADGYPDKSGGTHDGVRCDLCLQLGGSAGTPSQLQFQGRPPLAAEPAPQPALPAFPAKRRVGTQLPRAPPSQDLI